MLSSSLDILLRCPRRYLLKNVCLAFGKYVQPNSTKAYRNTYILLACTLYRATFYMRPTYILRYPPADSGVNF